MGEETKERVIGMGGFFIERRRQDRTRVARARRWDPFNRNLISANGRVTAHITLKIGPHPSLQF